MFPCAPAKAGTARATAQIAPAVRAVRRTAWSGVVAVGGEEGPRAGVGVPVEVGGGGGLVDAAEHRLVEGEGHHEPVEVCGGERWIVKLQQAAPRETLERRGQ